MFANNEIYAYPNKITPNKPIIFDSKLCNGCNKCVAICTMDLLVPNPERGKPPIVLYPEECYYEGDCVCECPNPGAIKLNHPLMSKVRFKRKQTGEHFKIK